MAACLFVPVRGDFTQATLDARYPLGYLVVTAYGAIPDDGLDDTAAIQAAINDAFPRKLAVFLPTGTYDISDTLKCQQWMQITSTTVNSCGNTVLNFGSGPFRQAEVGYGFVLIGEHSASGGRPKIRLMPSTASDFDTKTNPRPLLMLRNYKPLTSPAVGTNPQPAADNPMGAPDSDPTDGVTEWAIDTSFVFNCVFQNIDFDCGGHPGAIGVCWPAAQGSCLADSKVDATDAYAGFYGLAGRDWGAINIEVIGGDYGILAGTKGDYSAGAVAVGVKLVNQKIHAVHYVDFVPMVLVGFDISKDYAVSGATADAPIWMPENTTSSAFNTLSLLDGRIELIGANGGTPIPAIDNPGNSNPSNGTISGKNLYVRNVYTKGTTLGVRSSAGAGASLADATNWHQINEYAFTDQRYAALGAGTSCAAVNNTSLKTHSVIGTVVAETPEPIGASVTTNPGNPPADLVSRHLPSAGFPYYEGSGTGKPAAIVVTASPYNAIPGDGIDDTAAIQQAINDAATSPTYNGRVYIPAIGQAGQTGAFELSTSLLLAENTALFGADKIVASRIQPLPSWNTTATNGTLIRTVDSPTATCFLGHIGLWVPNVYENSFTYYEWSAGVGSMTYSINLESKRPPNNASPVPPAGVPPWIAIRYAGNAGGRHYFIANASNYSSTQVPNRHADRSVSVDRTVLPLWFYGFNLEGGKMDDRDYDGEIDQSTNVAILGWKREGGMPMLKLNQSMNIVLHGAGAMREAADTNPSTDDYIQIYDSDYILMSNLLVQSNNGGTTPPGGLLRDTTASTSLFQIPYPESVSVFKKNVISDLLMYPAAITQVIEPVADAFVANNPPVQNTNYGSSTLLSLRLDPSWGKESYLRFDLSSVTGQIIHAQLILQIQDNTHTADVTHEIYPVASDTWGESTITWTNRPSPDTAISDPVVITPSMDTGTKVQFDVTSHLLAYTGTGDALLSLCLQETSPAPSAAGNLYYHSRNVADATKHPKLVLTVKP